MPPIEYQDLTDVAVIWDKQGVDNYGETVISSPREIKIRQTFSQSENLDPISEDDSKSVIVITCEDVSIGCILWLGSLDDYFDGLPSTPTELIQVISRDLTKDIKGRVTRYQLRCMKYSDTLPVVET